MEGIPVNDLVGGSQGFRRSGYVITLQPGLTYKFNKLNFFATVGLALVVTAFRAFLIKKILSLKIVPLMGTLPLQFTPCRF